MSDAALIKRLDGKEVIKRICEETAGICLQTIVSDPFKEPQDPVTVFRADFQADVHFYFDSNHVTAELRLEDEAFERLLQALETMNGFEFPEDGKEMMNVVTFIPGKCDENVIVYAAAFLGLFIANLDERILNYIFFRDEFKVFGIDTQDLEEETTDEVYRESVDEKKGIGNEKNIL